MLVSDEQLVQRSQQGDVAAFEALIGKYQQRVYNIAFRLMGNHHDASDLAQEALIKVYRSIGKFRGESSFTTWLYHVVSNVCRDELRRRSRHPVSSLDEPVLTGDGSFEREVADLRQGPEDLIAQKEFSQFMQTLINSLHPEYRMVIVMREMMGFSYEEIAGELQISLGTVKSRISRARKFLQERILAERELCDQDERLILERGKAK